MQNCIIAKKKAIANLMLSKCKKRKAQQQMDGIINNKIEKKPPVVKYPLTQI
jgi:hypothetical protein